MGLFASRRLVRALLVVGGIALVLAAIDVGPLWWSTREPETEANRLAALVGVRPGDTVAEVGAGHGRMALQMAGVVGASGRVYATELGDEALRTLGAAVAGVTNIEVRPAALTATGLPDACCSLIYMRLVYHHLVDPVVYVRGIARALAPGGALIVIDFDSRLGLLALLSPAERGGHGVSLDEVVREVTSAGLAPTRLEPRWTMRTFLAEFRK
jgi:ubiquinone/menaquinone biosynthesis C-methylase UbiE